jgi:glycerol-3-phosphate dehydrogenase
MKPFSHQERAELIERHKKESFDLVVVGGGITGAFIAWDAALRGLRTALVEQGDFASGTSSRSSRLVHGGLRYLEQLHFGLVFESTHERRILLEMAPHLVRVQPFVVPVYAGDKHPRFVVDLGLWLYDLIAGMRSIGRHRSHGIQALSELEPALTREGLQGGLVYHDCAADDARLTLAAVRSAYEAGAMPVSRVRFERPLYDEGHVSGVGVSDRLGDRPYTIRTRTVVNAAGPWTDHVLSTYPGSNPPMLRTSKGVHLVVPWERLPVRHAVVMSSPRDRRATFCVPWRECTYIGTTDTDYREAPEDVRVERSDVAYLLETVKRYFPSAALGPMDVLSTWAGVRPLVSQAKGTPYDVSREHTIAAHPGGAFTITGGKLTTCRKMAEQMVDKVIGWLRSQDDRRRYLPCSTSSAEFFGGGGLSYDALPRHRRALETRFGVSTFTADHVLKAYGIQAESMLEFCSSQGGGMEPIVSGLPYLWGELAHSVADEMVLTLEDFLMRRTHIFYKAPDQGAAIEEIVAERLGELLGWDDNRKKRELAWYRSERQKSVAFRVRKS